VNLISVDELQVSGSAFPGVLEEADLVDHGVGLDAELCLEAALGVVDACVDDLAVPAAGGLAGAGLLLQDVDLPVAPGDLGAYGEAHRARADDDGVHPVHVEFYGVVGHLSLIGVMRGCGKKLYFCFVEWVSFLDEDWALTRP
jgi:hypothetical protein